MNPKDMLDSWLAGAIRQLFDVFLEGIIANDPKSIERFRNGLAVTQTTYKILADELKAGWKL